MTIFSIKFNLILFNLIKLIYIIDGIVFIVYKNNKWNSVILIVITVLRN